MVFAQAKRFPDANMPMQYTCTIMFHSRKNGNFQMKICDIFLIFAQNIDCGYNRLTGSNKYPQSMFKSKNKKPEDQ